MNAPLVGSSSMTGLWVFVAFVLLVICIVHFLHHQLDPLRRLVRFRVPAVPGMRFERLAYATMGDIPSRRTLYRYTLAFAIDSDWVYLRHSPLPFLPAFWRLPLKQVHLCEHDFWTIRISATTPPFHADFGPSFIAALKGQRK